jgi:hypothetical protein
VREKLRNVQLFLIPRSCGNVNRTLKQSDKVQDRLNRVRSATIYSAPQVADVRVHTARERSGLPRNLRHRPLPDS